MSPKKKGGYSGAYRDSKDRIRPITPRKRSGAKTGVPVKLKKPPVRQIATVTPSETEVDEERAKIALAHGIKLPPGKYTRVELRRQHAARTEAAQEMDDQLKARIAKDQREWRNRPNKVDIIGIDRFPLKVQREFVAHFPEQVAMMEDYYETETNVTSYKLYADRDEWGDRASRGVVGYYDQTDSSIHLSPDAAKVVAKGEIKSREDYFFYHSIFHEVGHGMGPGGYKDEINHIGKPQQFFGEGFDEGANEILSHRFTIDNIKMPRELRQRLTRTDKYDQSFYEDASAYHQEQKVAARVALLAGKGDERKAIDWMGRLRYADTEKEAQGAINQLNREIDRAKKNIVRRDGRQSYTYANVESMDAKMMLNYSKRGGDAQSNVADILLKANGYDDPYQGSSPRSEKYSYHLKVKTQRIDRDDKGKLVILDGLKVAGQKEEDFGVKMIAPWWMIV